MNLLARLDPGDAVTGLVVHRPVADVDRHRAGRALERHRCFAGVPRRGMRSGWGRWSWSWSVRRGGELPPIRLRALGDRSAGRRSRAIPRCGERAAES